MNLQQLMDEFASVNPQDVTVLSGAGLSVEGPSSLPTGEELTKRVFDAFFLPGTLKTIRSKHAAVGWFEQPLCPSLAPERKSRLPRLETVLGVAARIHGPEAIDRSTADMAVAEPNRLHRFFAQHLDRGGSHLTANFDECIERAAAATGANWANSDLLHFHGSVGGAGALGATLERIERGFSPDLAHKFLALLTRRPMLLVAGYSGSDFFDVNTVIAELPPHSLRGLRVVWLLHSDHDPHLLPIQSLAPDEPTLSIFDILLRQGADLSVVCAPTDFLLGELVRRWQFTPLGSPLGRSPKDPHIDVDHNLPPVATFALYLDVGLFGEVSSLAQAAAPLMPADEVRSATSAALWEAGRWNDVRRLWRRVRPRTDTTRLERIGASLWVQGRLLPAFAWLTWHRRRASGDARQVLAETEGRVLEHMLRTPDLRWLARHFVHGVLGELGQTDQTIGVTLYRRRTDLASSLGSTVGGEREPHHAMMSSEWFGQAGNVLAWVTYQHRRLRDSYRDTDSAQELGDRYSVLREWYQAVGSKAGGIRTHLLPGAHRVFPTSEVLTGVFDLQYGWWQRFRIVARHAVKRELWLRRAGQSPQLTRARATSEASVG